MLFRKTLGLGLVLLVCSPAWAQYIPRHVQLKSDPITGSIAGGQTHLRTDPERTVGSIYVNPYTPSLVAPAAYNNQLADRLSTVRYIAEQELNQAKDAGANEEVLGAYENMMSQIDAELQRARSYGPVAPYPTPYYGHGGYGEYGYGSGAPFDSTRGLRNYQTPFGAPEALESGAASRALLEARAMGAKMGKEGLGLIELYHQPLIQIKVRVIEVIRDDAFQANSVLEYVSQADGNASLTSGQPANGAFDNFRKISRFASEGFVENATSGAGLLLNLTTEHINAAVQLLANELNADVVTAPQVVTLNGQNVEFVSGQKIPFQFGQNVVQGTNNNIQQFFYKNIGTYVSVTPKIVNWGFHGEGRGAAAIVAGDIRNWNELAGLLLDPVYFEVDTELRARLIKYSEAPTRVLPFDLKAEMLKILNQYSRSELLGALPVEEGHQPQFRIPGIDRIIDVYGRNQCDSCDWKPQDCTIDLALVVRLSEAGTQAISTATDDAIETNVENNVRAVANVIQIKSGEGVVMAGLIGERELENTAKVPVLGDIPIVGAAFRSRESLRQKTEVLIFIEAEVLDPRPEVARVQSGKDLRLGQPYLDYDLLNNPIDCGFRRLGFGQYLPCPTNGEAIYWRRHHPSIQKMRMHLGDFFR